MKREINVTVLLDSVFHEDGGAMFSRVPKSMWSKELKPDSSNKVPVAVRTLLLKTPKKNILVDTGLGTRLTTRMKRNLKIRKNPALVEELRRHGVERADVHCVILTHLHPDHSGGCVMESADGTLIPAFPNAEYIVQKGEFLAGSYPSVVETRMYNQDDFLPLHEAGRLRLLEGDEELIPGVHLLLTPGHTRHHQSVLIDTDEERFFYPGDLVPTTHHLKLTWNMAFDLYPKENAVKKKDILNFSSREGWIVIFPHDTRHIMGKVQRVELESFHVIPTQEKR
ncbi:MAG: MBL fold metallo-hydrolase [bacterium]